MKRVLGKKVLITAGALVVAALIVFALVGGLASRGGAGSSTAGSASRTAGQPVTLLHEPGFAAAATERTATGELGKAPIPQPASGPGSSSDAGSATANGSGDTVPAFDPNRFLVRTGRLDILVDKGQAPQVANHIVAAAEALGGYVLSSNVSSGLQGERPYAEISVRVPARSYDQAIKQFGALGQVKNLTTSAEDVTGSYVDLQARLSHYRAVESRLLTFLAQAGSIQQALSIQQRIDNTQLTVERLSAQLKALRETVVYGTLAVSVAEKGGKPVVTPPAKPASFIGAFVHSVKLIWVGAKATLVALGAGLPFIAVFAGLAYAVWSAYRRLNRGGRPRTAKTQGPAQGPELQI
jgi:hypothetical protein